mmetsp:Transcript_9358/g.30786  ORF Transcript_9358/g.30786 Transcript_9358/m.30786 type:complete len:242 (-) Transcript_9358:49-774(-)|eukprot:CAMPEP_0182908880 /NCGR_PEP_ID=MMETSP0034_2-20130328/35444_1 /TAXON_ID=156128 /ORGANISM="Nephroselmis pyriformis, Strain CCMP717" /LENGTH=241 /DNA_ID=CAMNT_0025045087 /DNA_START=216 /DNA_END=941 /DNA_ORIENTATION=+
MEDFEREIKILVVGNGTVGKTSMIRRFARGIFTDEYKKTIGVDFLEKTQWVDALGEDVRLMLWDTAGQDEFDSLTRSYYRGAGACVLAFSTVDRDSFEAIPRWKAKVEAECGDIAMCLVQNKIDLLDQATVSQQDAEAMARKLGLRFYRTCVKDNLNVTEVFEYLSELHVKKVEQGVIDAATPAVQSIGASVGNPSAARGEAAARPAEREREAQTVKLTKPSKQRTGGKKKIMDKMNCTVG